MPAGGEADIGVAEPEPAVERGQHEMDLARADLVAVGPAGDAAVSGARVQGEVHEALVKAQERDARALGDPRCGLAANLRDHRPAGAGRARRRHNEVRRGGGAGDGRSGRLGDRRARRRSSRGAGARRTVGDSSGDEPDRQDQHQPPSCSHTPRVAPGIRGHGGRRPGRADACRHRRRDDSAPSTQWSSTALSHDLPGRENPLIEPSTAAPDCRGGRSADERLLTRALAAIGLAGPHSRR